jgi:hypothetical protein
LLKSDISGLFRRLPTITHKPSITYRRHLLDTYLFDRLELFGAY